MTTAADYLPIIIATVVGFAVLAALLLIPVSRFLTRERDRGDAWNAELERRNRPATPPRTREDADGPAS